MNDRKTSLYLKPFILTLILVIVDQITKIAVVRNIPVGTIKYNLWDGFLWICHARNTGVAFSMGDSGSDFFRIVFFTVLPIFVIAGICYMVATEKPYLSKAQRWYAAGIAGGGIGTIIDRIFRFREGVVDFISVKFYGIFGLDRWPTFNVSDSCVVVFVILFVLSVLLEKKDDNR